MNTDRSSAFKKKFAFDPSKALYIGVEREAFLADHTGRIVPRAPETVPSDEPRIGYELSACQIESRIGPCCLAELERKLIASDELVRSYARGLAVTYKEVAPADMPLDVFPDPSGRYQRIVQCMSHDVLLAACRIIGTHIHIGMPDHATALRVYDGLAGNGICAHLSARGDHSGGERLKIYRSVSPDCDPRPYGSWRRFYEAARDKGFESDPRRCWTLIRISRHGTIEFRMFGATESHDEIISWAEECRAACTRIM